MATLKDIEGEVVTALKAGNRPRVDVLRMLVNQTKLVAKNDTNREVRDDDVITAANRIIKQARETRSFLPEGDSRANGLDAEIAIVTEFLPQQMDREELDKLIGGLVEEGLTGENPKAARGIVMKTLNSQYRGRFDSQIANEILMAKL
jgi:uncharacterized protein